MHRAQRVTHIARCSWKLANTVQTAQPLVGRESVSHQGWGASERADYEYPGCNFLRRLLTDTAPVEEEVQATVQRQSTPNSVPAEKHCPACDRFKAAYHFIPHPRSRDGLRHICEECTRDLKGQEPLPEPTVHEKLCTLCTSSKPAAAFNRSSRTKTGLQGYCRECSIKVNIARQRTYAQHNLELGRPAAHKQKCSQCKRFKPASEFDRDMNKSSGLYGKCKDCRQQHRKQMYNFVPFSEPPEEKLCSMCNKIRPAAEFHRTRINATGLSSYCKECALMSTRRWRKEGKIASAITKSGLIG